MNIEDLGLEFEKYRQVRLSIGGDGKKYQGLNPQFEITGAYSMGSSMVVLMLPETVAEYFRQQGRRELQSELRTLLNASRQ